MIPLSVRFALADSRVNKHQLLRVGWSLALSITIAPKALLTRRKQIVPLVPMLPTRCQSRWKIAFLARMAPSVWLVQDQSHVRKDITVQNTPTAPASIRARKVTMVQTPELEMSKSVVLAEWDSTAQKLQWLEPSALQLLTTTSLILLQFVPHAQQGISVPQAA